MTTSENASSGQPCHLCARSATLKDSHTIPNWVYRDELRGKGGSFVDLNEYRSHSHACTYRLLCGDCEQLFSGWENPAKLLGRDGEPGSMYGPWLLKFATSISWRVTKYYQLQPPEALDEATRKIVSQPFIDESLATWKRFLLDDVLTANSKNHRQHLFIVSPDYLLRKAMAMWLVECAGHTFVWTRFSIYCFLGILHTNNPRELRTSEIRVSGGQLPHVAQGPLALMRCLTALERDGAARLVAYAKKDDPEFWQGLQQKIN